MRSHLKILAILALAVSLVGCSHMPTIFGHSSQAVARQNNAIVKVQNKISNVNENKVAQVQSLSYGVDYSLGKSTNKEPAVLVAKELNARVQSIVGLPELQQQKEMMLMVENLVSNNVAGQFALAKKDAEIILLQTQSDVLVKAKNEAVNNAITLSEKVASENDASQAELSKYTGWFGLSAIAMGFKQLIHSIFWFLIIGGIIFLILRILSTVNPIAGAIFGIFDMFFSWVVNTIKVIAPKAMTIANTVETSAFNATSSALGKVVDAVETVKLTSSASGTTATVEDLLDTAELSMNSADKTVIENLKIQLGWTKPSTTSTVPASVSTPKVVAAPTAVPVVTTVPAPVASPTVIVAPVASPVVTLPVTS